MDRILDLCPAVIASLFNRFAFAVCRRASIARDSVSSFHHPHRDERLARATHLCHARVAGERLQSMNLAPGEVIRRPWRRSQLYSRLQIGRVQNCEVAALIDDEVERANVVPGDA